MDSVQLHSRIQESGHTHSMNLAKAKRLNQDREVLNARVNNGVYYYHHVLRTIS